MKFIGLVGTNSKRSTNRQLLQYIQKHFADKADIELVEIKDLPVFNKPANKQLPESVLEIVKKIDEPVMITGASYGTLGASRAQLQLRQILNAPEIKANVLPDEFLLSHSLQAFDSNGDLVDLDVIKKLDAIFDDFRLYVKITGKLSHATELLHKEAEDFDWESL